MLISYSELKTKYKINPTGILHIGASTGQEVKEYYDNGIQKTIWIEADPKVFTQLSKNLESYKHALPVNAVVSYVNDFESDFYITDNNGESSSLLKMGTHKDVHPDVKVIETITVKTSTVTKILENLELEIKDYDFLNIDIQGAELMALKGMKDLLKQVNFAYIEVNNKELYKGCPMIEEIDEYLEKRNLLRVEVKWANDTGWGDAFYINRYWLERNNPEVLNQLQPRSQKLSRLTDFQQQAIGRITRESQPTATVEIFKTPAPQKGHLQLSSLIDKFEMKVLGIINIGASLGEQVPEYKNLGINNLALVEPLSASFTKMEEKYRIGNKFYNVALTDFEGNHQMNVSTGDLGKASSFLKPTQIFKAQYPGIDFYGSQHTPVTKLDMLGVDVGLYNMISMDTNGNELLVLKGGMNTLNFVHYILTRVFFAELYQGCPQVEQMDDFLKVHGFIRVDTDKGGGSWGTALYAKRQFVKLPKEKKLQEYKYSDRDVTNAYLEMSGIENEFVEKVPAEYRPHKLESTPEDNHFPFEEWYYKNFSFTDQRDERVYLPVFWDSYYSNNSPKSKPAYIQELDIYLKGLDKEKKYYTITSYDNGMPNILADLDIKVFYMNGINPKINSFSLPLVSTKHVFELEGVKKDIYLSFVGKITDPVREEILKMFPKDNKDFYITERPHRLEDYCDILKRSKYVLCPRGKGPTSYRVQEALQYGAIPVYIKDETKDKYGIDAGQDISKDIILKVINEWEEKYGFQYITPEDAVISVSEKTARFNYQTYFTFEKIKQVILQNLK